MIFEIQTFIFEFQRIKLEKREKNQTALDQLQLIIQTFLSSSPLAFLFSVMKHMDEDLKINTYSNFGITGNTFYVRANAEN